MTATDLSSPTFSFCSELASLLATRICRPLEHHVSVRSPAIAGAFMEAVSGAEATGRWLAREVMVLCGSGLHCSDMQLLLVCECYNRLASTVW